MKKLLLPILLFSLLSSCKGSQEEIIIDTIYPIEECKNVTSLDEYIDDIEVITLDPRYRPAQNNHITLSSKTGHIFYVDARNQIVEIDKKGDYVRTLSRRGRSRKEFISINALALSLDESQILLLDDATIKVLGITNSNIFKEISIPSSLAVDAIAPAAGGDIYLYTAYPTRSSDQSTEKLLHRINDQGEILESQLDRVDFTASICNITKSHNNRYILRPQSSEHIYYELGAKAVSAEMKLDFQDRNIPEDYYLKTANKDMRQYFLADYCKLPIYIYDTQNHLSFSVADKEATEYKYLYNKERREGINWQNVSGVVQEPYLNFIASDADGFYLLFDCGNLEFYQKEDSDNHSALFRLICSYLERENITNSDDTLLVKVKFNL